MKNLHKKNKNEDGFSLLEATVATVIMLVVLLSVFSAFTYSIVFNSGNNKRSQCLSVLQKQIELYRSYKFTPTVTDDALLGGTKAAQYATSSDGTNFKVEVTVDDDPLTTGTQVDTTKTLKEITITVSPTNKVESWQTSVVSSVTLRRVRGN